MTIPYKATLLKRSNNISWDKNSDKFTVEKYIRTAHVTAKDKNYVVVRCERRDFPKSWHMQYEIQTNKGYQFLKPDSAAVRCKEGKAPFYSFLMQWNQKQLDKAESQHANFHESFNPLKPAQDYLDSLKIPQADVSKYKTEVIKGTADSAGEDFAVIEPTDNSVSLVTSTTSSVVSKFASATRRSIDKAAFSRTNTQETDQPFEAFVTKISKQQKEKLSEKGIIVENLSIIPTSSIKAHIELEQAKLRSIIGNGQEKAIITPLCLQGNSVLGRKRQHAVLAIITPNDYYIIDSKRPFYNIPKEKVLRTNFQPWYNRSDCTKYAAYTLQQTAETIPDAVQIGGSQPKSLSEQLAACVKSLQKPTRKQISPLFNPSLT